MVPPKVVILLLLISAIQGSSARTRFLVKLTNNASDLFKTKHDNLRNIQEPIAATRSPLHETDSNLEVETPTEKVKFERRNSFMETSTFNPDVLNKFLEDYAIKIKSTTEKNYRYPFTVVKPPSDSLTLGVAGPKSESMTTTTSESSNSSETTSWPTESANDTLERNNHRGTSDQHEDRNGWVTLEAIPWSKSKISKWQANQNTQRPWPDQATWEKPPSGKPWPSRPPSPSLSRPDHDEDDMRPWSEKPKPHRPGNNQHQKPWYESEPGSPNQSSRPSYFDDNKFDGGAQKWPPERPWNQDSLKHTSDIITDERPSNFPDKPSSFLHSWDKQHSSKPHDRFSEDDNEWKKHGYDFPSKFEELNNRPSNAARPSAMDRPYFSQYHYPTEHPPSHPLNGDGEWVLLSSNRGYSKSRQRSIKIATPDAKTGKDGPDPTIAVVTSKRQVRLTVLPSVDGNNTTTSHGGILEVEKTFKTVDQSQKEYERGKLTSRPIRKPSTASGQPSNSAVLAAVGAGMLPATMAMMIPMVLGRKRRGSGGIYVDQSIKKFPIDNESDDLVDRLNDERRMKMLKM